MRQGVGLWLDRRGWLGGWVLGDQATVGAPGPRLLIPTHFLPLLPCLNPCRPCSRCEVIGLLGGSFDSERRVLAIQEAYPCRRAEGLASGACLPARPPACPRLACLHEPDVQVSLPALCRLPWHQCRHVFHSQHGMVAHILARGEGQGRGRADEWPASAGLHTKARGSNQSGHCSRLLSPYNVVCRRSLGTRGRRWSITTSGGTMPSSFRWPRTSE